jgi:hypothetical protein
MAKQKRRRCPSGMSVADRLAFYSLPEPNSGCVLWTGSAIPSGYGNLRVDGKSLLAHRLSWQEQNGPIPNDMHVLHRCDVPACINPDHLFLGTDQTNSDDKVSKQRQSRGERAGTAKLTAADVLAIRAAPGTNRQVAKVYGVDNSQVSRIKRGHYWAHVS